MWPFSPKRIYLDHASATPVCGEAADAYARAAHQFGNPGAIHAEGVAAKRALENARTAIAAELAVKPRQILFTSGSTEGNNLCIVGLAQKLIRTRSGLAGTHWVVSSIEHPSVLESFGEVERLGGQVTFVDPDARGIILADAVRRALRPETVLVSAGWANHEIGTVQPLREIATVVHANGSTLLHSDLGQAPLYKAPHMHTLGVDMAVIGSGKLYGPRGVGCVYLANTVSLVSSSFGGDQERGLRAGTESPSLAAGFAAALRWVGTMRVKESKRVAALRSDLARAICTTLPQTILNTSLEHSLPHILNISIPGIDPEYTVLAFDRAGIALSTKSACNAGEKKSHVVAALGGAEWRAETTLRFSLGVNTTARDIARTSTVLAQIVTK